MIKHSVYHIEPNEWVRLKEWLKTGVYELGEREAVVLHKETGAVMGNVRYGTMVIELDTTNNGLENSILNFAAQKPWDGSPIIKEDIFGNRWRSA